jgi:hypothetical protein
MARAEMFWTDYTLVSHDAEAGVATIRKTATGEEYTVELATGGCTCPDSLYRCAALNARLIAKGLTGGVCCKHGSGVAQRLVEAQKQPTQPVRVRASAKTYAADWGN